MATATFLSGATCNITPTGGAAVDVSDQLSKCEVMLGFELPDRQLRDCKVSRST